MAGDWMKVELDTPDKPEIQYIAGVLNIDGDSVVGKLLRVWAWFDRHTENGNALGVTYSFIDRIAGVAGFAEAMALAGWLKQDGNILVLPRFDRHNGKTAKNRALTNERVAKSRKMKRIGNDECNAGTAAEIVTREEKRREEEKDSPPLSRQASVWDLWVSIAGESKRGVLGKLIRQHGEDRALLAVSKLSLLREKVDPVAYVTKMLDEGAAESGKRRLAV